MNKACRDKDLSKLYTLGPLISTVVGMNNDHQNEHKHIYRGIKMDIQDFKEI
jgi:hypothetical protein